MMNKLYKPIIFLILIIFNFGCRVEIIEPYNPAGNKNVPVKAEKENYFNIAINADRLSTEMNFDANFSSENNVLSFKANDKRSGTCRIQVISSENKTLYSAIIEIRDIDIRQRINQGVPSIIRIVCDNFTEKLQIVIHKTF